MTASPKIPGESFPTLNRAYGMVFQPGRLSLGLVVPIENYAQGPIPTLERHLERVQLAEELGFSAVWLRDVPFHVPSFGDAGQTFDPFVYLGYLAARTRSIGLGVASVVLPLRHPAHVAKASASVDQLSDGRLLLGVASGDRPLEYPGMAVPFEKRGAMFRDSFEYLRNLENPFPAFENEWGRLQGNLDMLPKPSTGRIPLLITGSSQQNADWLAHHGDGWMVYPRDIASQAHAIRGMRNRIRGDQCHSKPVMQPLYLDLVDDPEFPPEPIHLGIRVGVEALVVYLQQLEEAGVNHVAFNLRFHRSSIEKTLQTLADRVIPALPPLRK